MIRVARVLQIASLALWVGGLSTLSFVVAPTAFKVAPSRQTAGLIVGASLKAFGGVEIVCGLAAVGSSVLLRWKIGRGTVAVAFTLVMLMITISYVGWVYPAAAGAREAMNKPHYGIPLERSAEENFAVLHRISVILVGTNIILGTCSLVCAAGTRTDGA